MLKSEFESHIGMIRKPTDEEYSVINMVYSYHPCFAICSGKERIARLYSEYGMRIILDMQETAKRIQEIRERKAELQKELYGLDLEEKELKEGVW